MILEKLNFKNSVKKFADGTTIHGFKEFYYCKSKIFKVFWSIVLLAALTLTIFHMYKSILNYHNQPTVITFESVKHGEMNYPDLTLCYPHWVYWVDWKKVIKLGFNKATALYGLSHLTQIYTESYFNTTTAKCRFERRMAEINFTKLSQFYEAIAFPRPPRTTLQSFFKKYSLKFLHSDNNLCYVISGNQLFNFTKVDIFGWGVWFNIRNDVKFIHNEFVNGEEYRKYVRSILFKPNSSLLKEKYDHEQNSLSDYQLPLSLQLSENHLDALVISPDAEKYVVKLTATVRKWKNKKSKPCIEGKVQTVFFDNKCLFKCLSKILYTHCKQYCKEFHDAIFVDKDQLNTVCRKKIVFLKNSTSTESLSTSTKFRDDDEITNSNETCQDSKLFLEAKAYCREVTKFKPESCPLCAIQSCEQWEFERSVAVTMHPKSVHETASQAYTSISIRYPIEESIIAMSEVDSLTWDSLIADIGGVLGIWLGASLVTFVQLVYLCCFADPSYEDKSTDCSKSVDG